MQYLFYFSIPSRQINADSTRIEPGRDSREFGRSYRSFHHGRREREEIEPRLLVRSDIALEGVS